MIAFLHNEEIDREKWDNCLSEIPGLKPYSLSWYLDIMAPGWSALIDDDYETLMPLPVFRRYGFNYIATPVFLQQLGVYSPDSLGTNKAREFLGFIPDFFRLIDLSIAQDIEVPGFKVTGRTNFELSLKESYDELWFNYSTDCRRNINIARRYPQDIIDNVMPQEIITLFRNNIGARAGVIREISYRRLHHLMDFCLSSGRGKILGVRSPKGKLLWGIFIIEANNRLTLLFTAGSKKSRELRTAYYVIDSVIRDNSGSAKIVDFAGSSVPSIAMFMKSFGGLRTTYYRIYRNSLPWPVRLLK